MIQERGHLRDVRSFCGERFPWPLIDQLANGTDVTACYLVQESRRLEKKNGDPFLRLVLGDRTGVIDAVVWDDIDRLAPHCTGEFVLGVHGRVGVYQEKPQLTVQSAEPLDAGPADLELLLPVSPRPLAAMGRELDDRIASVADPALRRLLGACLGSDTELGRDFRSHPGAKRNHHAYVGGLLEHTLSVTATCDALAVHYLGQGAAIDQDLLVTAALLHDLGKVRELKSFPAPGYTTEGHLLGHIVIGIQLVGRAAERVEGLAADRLLLLQHLIASHQGKPEWDSPKVPQLLEGLILHYADDLDAKMNQARGILAGVPAGEWSPYDRGFGRAFFHPPETPAADEVEPVPAEKAAGLSMDLFQG